MNKVTYVDNVTVIEASNLNEIQDEIERLDTEKADIDSPTFTGTPTAPTPTEGDSSTKIATTEFVEKKTDSTYITGTASGEIASFSDGADGIPVQSLTASITAVQNLNGYDHPWVGGSGKNKYWLKSEVKRGLTLTANADGTYTLTGTFDGTSNNTIGNSDVVTLNAGTYILNSGVTSSYYGIQVYNNDASATVGTSYGTDATFTLSADTNVTFRGYIRYDASMVSANVTFKPMLRLSGTTSDWQPYENICPISGYSSVNVVDCGKNLLDIEDASTTVGGLTFTMKDEVITINGTNTGSSTFLSLQNYADVDLPNGSYTIKSLGAGASNTTYQLAMQITGTNYYITTNDVTFTIDDDHKIVYLWLYCYSAHGAFNNLQIPIMISKESADFESYNGTTTTINLGSTCYGGTLGVTSGEQNIVKGYVDLGSLDWTYDSGVGRFQATLSDKRTDVPLRTEQFMCSAYTSVTDGRPVAQVPDGSIYNAQGNPYIYVHDSRFTSASEFKAGVSGYQLVYDLATSQTVTLTPTQVQTVLGENNLWADSGSVSVVYRADTQMKIAETSWNFLGTCLSGTTVTLTLPNNWTGIVRIWYPYQTTALRYYEIYAICDSNGAVHQFAVSNTSTITLTQAQNTLTLATSSSSSPNTYYFTCEGSGKITATGLE